MRKMGVKRVIKEGRKAERGGWEEYEMGGREVWEEEEDGRKGRV
jgi:hypothetical protein